MPRKPLIAGNWKMHGDLPRTRELCSELVKKSQAWPDLDVAVFPPFISLSAAEESLNGSRIMLGAQNMHEAQSGAFTGEISAAMLLTVGCQLVILGHSERRHVFGETDSAINRKMHAALTAGLKPILCVGEKLEERKTGRTEEIVGTQLTSGLDGVSEAHMGRVTIAYEPVWAIGTGRVATVQQAGEVHRFIREWVKKSYSALAADKIRIQYGGSVKADNARGLLADPDIDGALVGGASLDPNEFDAIIRATG